MGTGILFITVLEIHRLLMWKKIATSFAQIIKLKLQQTDFIERMQLELIHP